MVSKYCSSDMGDANNLVDQESVKLTVLIPVHNWDVTSLLGKLLDEADSFQLWPKIEIIVLDDNSSDPVSKANNDAFACKNQRARFQYSCLQQNVGRSSIRNLLAEKAKGVFLLFMDCDVVPDSETFLRTYLKHAENGDHDIVCGGRSYEWRVMSGAEYDYHLYWGNKKEVKTASERNSMPWRHILTSNVMVRKKVFEITPLDERFVGYGYEDIEWGVRLAQKFNILHIDNTASHLGLVTKQKAYEKMRESVPNYLLLKELCPHAFHVSAISKLVPLLHKCSTRFLEMLDRCLKRVFLDCTNNRLAFVFFQLNFAVLLARSTKGPAHTV